MEMLDKTTISPKPQIIKRDIPEIVEEPIKPHQNRLATPVKKEYQGALNKGGFIGILDENFINTIDFSEGIARLKGDITQKFTIDTLRKKEVENKDFDYILLKSLYSIIFQAKENIEGNTIRINRKDLENFTGIQSRGENINEFIKKVSSFNNAYGFLPNGTHYKMLTYTGYNQETGVFSFDVAFILELIKIQQTEKIISKQEKRSITQENHSYLIHSDIAKEKDKIAILIVERIEQLLISAGERTKKPHIAIRTIIKDIPQLKEKIEKQSEAKHINQTLKRHFSKAYKLMKTKTDFYKYFTGLEIPEIISTKTTFETDVINIKHNGKNEKYNS